MQDPLHVQLSPVVPVIDDQDSVSIYVNKEHQLIPGGDPLRWVLGQSIKGRRLHNVALPHDRSGGGDLRLPIPQERRRNARVRGMGTAEGNEQTDPILIGANLHIIIGEPMSLVTDQRPGRNKALQLGYWLVLQKRPISERNAASDIMVGNAV